MIRTFWVKNFLSIRDKQELSFLTKGPVSELTVEITKGVFLYKLGVLYGANASGKSNMLFALNQVFSLLILPRTDADDKVAGCIPFALTKDEPTEMYVSFYARGIRYDYQVVFNNRFILSEALHYYPNGTKALFYERTFVGENVQAMIKFGPKLELQVKTQDRIREHTLNNHSVLSVCRKAALKEDILPFTELHSWIMTNYHDVDGDGDKGPAEILTEAYENPKKYRFYQIMLRKADVNILDYRPIVEDRILPEVVREHIQKGDMPEKVKEALLNPVVNTVSFVSHSDKGNFEIPLRWQSRGTLQYIRILENLYDMITGTHVYFLDEMGEDLHVDLLYYYLNAFLFNSDQSQLIITSQETSLLAQDLLNENRGAVWFVEKNRDTASSEYHRGDSFGLHKNLSLYNSYRIGKLGAKPELGSIFINLED